MPVDGPETSSAGQRPSPPFRFFPGALGFLLVGYMFFSKPFAYMARIPGTPIFGGELVLGLGVIEALRGRIRLRPLLRRSPALQVLVALMAFCSVRLPWDVPRYGLDAIRDSSIWYYGGYALLVAAAVQTDPTFIPRLVERVWRALPWFLLWVPIGLILARDSSLAAIPVPGAAVPINLFKGSDWAYLLAMVPVLLWTGAGQGRRLPSRKWFVPPAAILAMLALFSQSRTSLLVLGTTSAVALCYLPRHQRSRILVGTSGLFVLVLVPLVLLNPSIELGGRSLSLGQTKANIMSIVSRNATTDEESTGLQANITYRTQYFESVVRGSLATARAVTPIGFGPILSEIYSDKNLTPPGAPPLRSAHNSHITLLARIGVIGFGLWAVLWVVWFRQVKRLARRLHRCPGDPIGQLMVWFLVAVAGILLTAVSDPVLETPQGAIWLWTLMGAASGQAALARSMVRRTTGRDEAIGALQGHQA